MAETNELTILLPAELTKRLAEEATRLGETPELRVLSILEGALAPAKNFAEGRLAEGLDKLVAFLERIPAIPQVSHSDHADPEWWVKFEIDLSSPIAWHVVQELGHVLNYISLEERLPTVFYPVSPPPYMNGGPEEFLSWVIEAKIPFVDAGVIAEYLDGRLPTPVEDIGQWIED